jgi:hypothetical protein
VKQGVATVHRSALDKKNLRYGYVISSSTFTSASSSQFVTITITTSKTSL